MERDTIETRVDEIRAAHPGREEFVEAVKEFGRTLGEEDRELLGRVLLERKPETGGFDAIAHRLEEGGWIKRSLGRMAERERKIREEREPG